MQNNLNHTFNFKISFIAPFSHARYHCFFLELLLNQVHMTFESYQFLNVSNTLYFSWNLWRNIILLLNEYLPGKRQAGEGERGEAAQCHRGIALRLVSAQRNQKQWIDEVNSFTFILFNSSTGAIVGLLQISLPTSPKTFQSSQPPSFRLFRSWLLCNFWLMVKTLNRAPRPS